jgi:4-phytase/acid phosphatase
VLLAVTALPAAAAAAQVANGNAAHAGANAPAQVRLSIVVMRHGVRAPTKDPHALARYAAQPWPQWPVAPGMLTAHGAAGMQALGARYRQRWLGEGVLAPGCDAAQVVLIADSTPRNHASAAAFGEGLQPGCHAHYLALPSAQNNPLFHYAAGEDKNDDKDDDAVAAPLHPDAATRARLRALQRVLSGCQGAAACAAPAPDQDTPRLDDPQRLDDPAQAAKLLKTAGSLAENLMLEYAQGLPLTQVAWGRASPSAPVPAFALPVLISIARIPISRARCSRQTCTGAAQKRFCVNTPPTAAPSSISTTVRSLRLALRTPASATPMRTPGTANKAAGSGADRFTGMGFSQ